MNGIGTVVLGLGFTKKEFTKFCKLNPATLLKVTLLHGCFSRVLNCKIDTSRAKHHIFAYVIGVNPWVIGTYENHLYDKGGKNNWHFVTITYNQTASTYTWRNRANVQWTLYPTENENLLTVGKDCPYYKNGHTSAKIDIKGIYGPWNKLYTRK